MRTRIREIRRLRNLTLQQLADMVGTTAQTIQRLETDNMTVSLDWLEKIAAALDLGIAALLPGPHQSLATEHLGVLGENGAVVQSASDEPVGALALSVPGYATVSVKLTAPLGPFEGGTMLIGRKIDSTDFSDADGRDCVVKTRDNTFVVRKIAVVNKQARASMPFERNGQTTVDIDADWVAPLVYAVRPV